MKGTFIVLDAFLIDKVFQKIAWWFQRLTGRTNFWLARICYIVAALCYILWIAVPFSSLSLLSGLIVSLTVAFYVAAMLWMVRRLEKWEEIFLKNQGDQPTANMLRVLGVFIRIMGLFICLIVGSQSILLYQMTKWLSFLLGGPFVAIGVAGVYFQSCTPLPPCKSKVRECLEEFKTKLILVREES